MWPGPSLRLNTSQTTPFDLALRTCAAWIVKRPTRGHKQCQTGPTYPIDEKLSAADVEYLKENGITPTFLREFPVDDPFSLADVKKLIQYDAVETLKTMRSAPVDGPFLPEHVIQVARQGQYPYGEFHDDGPISVEEFIDRLR